MIIQNYIKTYKLLGCIKNINRNEIIHNYLLFCGPKSVLNVYM